MASPVLSSRMMDGTGFPARFRKRASSAARNRSGRFRPRCQTLRSFTIARSSAKRALTAFGTFFGEHAEHWLDHLGDYREAGPQLILQAYLQRIVNGGGRIEREYGLGRGRTDLLVLWPREAGQPSAATKRRGSRAINNGKATAKSPSGRCSALCGLACAQSPGIDPKQRAAVRRAA